MTSKKLAFVTVEPSNGHFEAFLSVALVVVVVAIFLAFEKRLIVVIFFWLF